MLVLKTHAQVALYRMSRLYLEMHTYAHIHMFMPLKLMPKEYTNLKDSKEEDMGGFGGKKSKEDIVSVL